ncbi:MAG: hypothetical protein EZS28_044754, partial [Streblomastix strix]
TLKKILGELIWHLYAWLFVAPVDIKGLNILDYLSIIKEPRDFGTIKKNIDLEQYGTDLSALLRDFYLVFDNSYLYNGATAYVSLMAEVLQKLLIKKLETSNQFTEQELEIIRSTYLTKYSIKPDTITSIQSGPGFSQSDSSESLARALQIQEDQKYAQNLQDQYITEIKWCVDLAALEKDYEEDNDVNDADYVDNEEAQKTKSENNMTCYMKNQNFPEIKGNKRSTTAIVHPNIITRNPIIANANRAPLRASHELRIRSNLSRVGGDPQRGSRGSKPPSVRGLEAVALQAGVKGAQPPFKISIKEQCIVFTIKRKNKCCIQCRVGEKS